MQITILEKNVNALVGRTEIKGKITFKDATPSNAQLTEGLNKELKKEVSLIVIKNIYTNFGHQEASFTVFVYNDQEAKNKAEMVTKHLKKKAEELAKAETEKKAAAAEEKKEEAPKAEEKKEEAPKAEEKEETKVEEKEPEVAPEASEEKGE
jgi:ribosomal protein S24E